jgi:uroporphyrinogen-III decarboxylase
VEECFTDMISPSAYGELNVPVMQRLIEGIRSFGMRSIFYYCGDPSGKWAHLLSLGADALSFEEGKKGFSLDVEDVVTQVAGRAVVLGNLDAIRVLQNGSDERLRDELTRQVAAGRRAGGRFIMSLGSPVTPGTPVARVRLYCDLVHQLGGSAVRPRSSRA